MSAAAVAVLAAALARAQAPARPATQEPDYAALVAQTTGACTVRSTVGPVDTPLSPAWTDFLMDHPALSSVLVRKYRIAPYRITELAPGRYLTDDGDGARGVVTLVEHTGGTRVYYGEGTQESALFRSIGATAVIVMSVEPVTPAGCPEAVRSSFVVYVKLRSRVLAGMVKALRPFLRRTITRKFSRAFLVAHDIGGRLAAQPERVGADILECPQLPEAERAAARSLLASLRPEPPACLQGRPAAGAGR